MANQTTALELASSDFPILYPDDTVALALRKIREEGLNQKIVYFYVADQSNTLLGVVPTRVLLTSALDARIREILNSKIITIDEHMPVHKLKEEFAKHKFLAFPVVDHAQRIKGVVDIEKFAVDLGEINSRTGFEDVYELLGLQDAENKSARQQFSIRFPWLLTTVAAGFACAGLTSLFEATLAQKIILTFFMTLILGLNESVAMQSATLTVQRLHSIRPSIKSLFSGIKHELRASSLLALACGNLVALMIIIWKHDIKSALIVGLSLIFSIMISSIWGTSVPYILHLLKKDAKVAAAPVALALSDLTGLLIYFSLASL